MLTPVLAERAGDAGEDARAIGHGEAQVVARLDLGHGQAQRPLFDADAARRQAGDAGELRARDVDDVGDDADRGGHVARAAPGDEAGPERAALEVDRVEHAGDVGEHAALAAPARGARGARCDRRDRGRWRGA